MTDGKPSSIQFFRETLTPLVVTGDTYTEIGFSFSGAMKIKGT